MNATKEASASGLELIERLDNQIAQLLQRCQDLKVENDYLHTERTEWLNERQDLLKKCEVADQGLDKAIARLERLEGMLKES